MMKQVLYTDKAPAPIGPYSQGIAVSDVEEFIFVSGQVAIDSSTGAFLADADVAGQTRQALTNLKAVLESRGCTMDNVVKTTVFLRNMDDFGAMNEVYATFFGANPPARSAVEIGRLPKDAKVEIEAIAVK